MAILEVDRLSKHFGGVRAIDDVSLEIGAGEAVGLIGPNGAGKTTLFDTVTGCYRPTSGAVRYKGKSIVGMRPDETNRLGIARTFQKLRPFAGMTVLENVMVGALCRTSSMAKARLESLRYLELVGISDKAGADAGGLSTGQRKRLELARAMATRPGLLLLDEVTGGVDPEGIPELIRLVRGIGASEGVTLLVVEHRMKVVAALCPRVVCLHLGRKIADGPCDQVLGNREVIRSYLGKSYVADQRS